MRKEFSSIIERLAARDKKIIFLTGDLGFMALENVREAMGPRFINAGVSEQNMLTMAAGLASEGLRPFCYSIAPFVVFRPAEQIRLDVCLHDMDVKIVGNGGGYGYGIMGSTHHAIEDIAVLSSFQNMRCYIPFCNEDVEAVIGGMMKRRGPAYLRLGYGVKPEGLKVPAYSHTRKLLDGDGVTVAGLGPVVLNVFKALERLPWSRGRVDLFAVSEMPLKALSARLRDSVRKTGRLIVIEEHVSQGGLGQNLALLLTKEPLACRLVHLHARGYPGGLYGSQAYHQKVSGLDPASIARTIKGLLHG